MYGHVVFNSKHNLDGSMKVLNLLDLRSLAMKFWLDECFSNLLLAMDLLDMSLVKRCSFAKFV